MNQHMPFTAHIVPTISSPPRPELPLWKSRRVKEYIESNLDRPIRNSELADVARLSRSHFCRAFHNSTGNPPHEYARPRPKMPTKPTVIGKPTAAPTL